jgi:hypothetical protein
MPGDDPHRLPPRYVARMIEAAWDQIPHERYEAYWAPFDARYRFRASARPEGWPAIDEPALSVTIDLTLVFEAGPSEFAAGEQAVNALTLLAMTQIVAVDERLLVLDWQRPSYWFRPHRQALQQDRSWPVMVFPNGDYHVFLTEDMTTGTFGHPWEQTLCSENGSSRNSFRSSHPGCPSSVPRPERSRAGPR